jgi:hypothetical protein
MYVGNGRKSGLWSLCTPQLTEEPQGANIEICPPRWTLVGDCSHRPLALNGTLAMTKEGADSLASELLGSVPEAFVHTALLAGGVGLWEWPIIGDRMALSPLPRDAPWLSARRVREHQVVIYRAAHAGRPAALRVRACRGDRIVAPSATPSFVCSTFTALAGSSWRRGASMRDSSGAAVRLVGTMQEIPAAVVTERRMRRQQGALLALVSNERDDNVPSTMSWRASLGRRHHPRRGAHQRLVVHGGPLETRLQDSVIEEASASDGRPGSRR